MCNGDHPTGYCPSVNKEMNYMRNQNQYQQRKTPYLNNSGYQQRRNNEQYDQGWRQEGGSSNRQNPYHNFNQNPQYQEIPSKIEHTLNQFMQMFMANQKRNKVAIKDLENQVGQLTKQLVDQ